MKIGHEAVATVFDEISSSMDGEKNNPQKRKRRQPLGRVLMIAADWMEGRPLKTHVQLFCQVGQTTLDVFSSGPGTLSRKNVRPRRTRNKLSVATPVDLCDAH